MSINIYFYKKYAIILKNYKNMNKLELLVQVDEFNSLLEFIGSITICEFNTRQIELKFKAKMNKNRLSKTDFEKSERLGSIPPCLLEELRNLIFVSIQQYKNLNTGKQESEKRASGIASNNSFKIRKNDWADFTEPKKQKLVVLEQRNSAQATA